MSESETKGFMCRILECPGRRPECSHEDGRFISQESFVGLAPGTEVPMQGSVVCCSLCERNGVVERVEDGLVVVHVQNTEVLGDGSRVEAEVFCRLPKESETENR
jgi:hypothetical protein